MPRTSASGFETRLLLNDGRVVPAAVTHDGSMAVAVLKGVMTTLLPHGAVDGLGFILDTAQRARCHTD